MGIIFDHSVYDEGDVWREESWTAHTASEVPYHLPMEVSTCVYVNGKHVYPGPDCPHYEFNDFNPGWTVLD